VKPANMAELHQVEGMGEKRIEKFGAELLELLKQYQAQAVDDGDTYDQTLQRFRTGQSVEAIAKERQLSVGTVYGHLARMIGEGRLGFDEVFELDEGEKKAIVDVIELLGDELKLRDVFESFDGQYSYDLIKCLIAEYQAGG
jgi:ATP-dependent DNA helicase RecQ